jgi:hypothetical protein
MTKSEDPRRPDSSFTGFDAQIARAESRGYMLVHGVVCMKKLVDQDHRHPEDARTEAEYDRLANVVFPGGPPRSPRTCCPYQLGMDHARMWRTGAGTLFATADPYHLDLGELDELRARATELGLQVTVSAKSMYAPGQTIMVVINGPGIDPSEPR